MPKQTFLNLPPEKQQLIVDCAVDEFSEQGYKSASISRIVAAAGIAKGSFYQYFEDKEDLYGYIIDYAIVQRKLRISRQEGMKLVEVNLTQFLRELFKSMLQEFMQSPKLLKISLDFQKHQYDPVQSRIRDKYKDISENYFQRFIMEEKRRGEIDANVDEDILSNMLMGASAQMTFYAQEYGFGPETTEYINRLTDNIEYILTHGIYRNTAR